ncbi:MAG: L-serine ammonia-lyase, iron-sulfur-dependent, subunit alpha [Bacteroidales bacterium]|nr:L-serine ammonia-lyase, iron-sulfur-dependent, subunit alpha [Bacteroidales bacterium]
MSLPSIFEVYQLAHGPSLPFTMGALKTGQYFRNVLMGIPHNRENRILIEFLGDFAIYGKDNLSDVAITCGIAGYIAGESRFSLKNFYNKIKKSGGIQLLSSTWAFSVDTDIIFNRGVEELAHRNTIRFHVLDSEQKVLLQAEYIVSAKGSVSGPGSLDQDTSASIEQIDNFADISKVCEKEKLELIDYIISAEMILHSITSDQIMERIGQIWQIMNSSITNGLNNEGQLPNHVKRQAKILDQHFSEQNRHWKNLGREHILSSIYALAVAEEIQDNQLLITAPLCETAALMPATLQLMQEKFSIPDRKLSEALLIGGLVGALLLKSFSQIYANPALDISFAISASMSAAAGCYLIDNNIQMINQAVIIAIRLCGFNHNLKYTEIGANSIKYTGIAIDAINLALCGYEQTDQAFDQFFRQLVVDSK